jgi:dipeptidase D
MGALAELQPNHVWTYFENICAIPHPSQHEEAVARYVVDVAAKLGFESRRDEVGNVVVEVPATPGMEDRPIVVLQGHLDMVPVAAPGVEHDFTRDPIQPYIDGDYVKARGTTLGADNGIGCALGLGLMRDETAEHGPLELFFTVNEESGMTGAHGLNSDFLKGRILINLDTEAWGEFFISCAGGGDSIIRLPIEREESGEGSARVNVRISGLKGGHSGIDINSGRGSGNKILARCLAAAAESADLRLISLAGGNKRNSIADGAEAIIQVPAGETETCKAAIGAMVDTIAEELAATDPGFKVEIDTEETVTDRTMTAASTRRVVDLLTALPHGVVAMSPQVPGLVETSINLGLLECEDAELKVTMLTRSALTSQLETVKQQVRTIGRVLGAEVEEPLGYPGWKPNMDSPLLKTAITVFRDLYGYEPEVKAVHAGLECGLFGEKLPGVDMISLGPIMHYVHSPDEEVHHPSVAKVYELLRGILKAIR